jgi:hypothetical protein
VAAFVLGRRDGTDDGRVFFLADWVFLAMRAKDQSLSARAIGWGLGRG